jgi:hypothetical protein
LSEDKNSKKENDVMNLTVREAADRGLITLLPDFDNISPQERSKYTFGSGAIVGKAVAEFIDALASKDDKGFVKAVKIANTGYVLSEIFAGIIAAKDELKKKKE